MVEMNDCINFNQIIDYDEGMLMTQELCAKHTHVIAGQLSLITKNQQI